MNVFPAIRAKMGRWDYFVVKMTMRELFDSVKFAADIYDDKTLDEAIQRVLDESRVKKSIVTYLVRQRDRFFSSIVVAALGGKPNWFPVTMEEDPRFSLFKSDSRLNESFGVLTFDGTQDYYALDGQHRLAAIKALVDPNSDVSQDAPQGFKNEEISVIVVVPNSEESEDDFMRRYRRLFGNLNRYAKPVDAVTNIIMDEDDAFAIITRRLITEHDFFRWTGRHRKSPRVKTTKGKNLKSTDSFFTSLEALYSINIRLLTSSTRRNNGWDDAHADDESYKKFRPSDEVIDSLFDELKLYWDGLLAEITLLKRQPVEMRDHSGNSSSGTEDCILFWPIGQEILAELARKLLDLQEDPSKPSVDSVRAALSGLGRLNWNFRDAPWRHLLLIPDSSDWSIWKIRSEERKEAQKLATRIVMWQIGIDELAKDEIERLRKDWQVRLMPALTHDQMSELWSQIESGAIR